MTRSDAVRKLSKLPFGPSCGQEPWLIDALVSLGVLKLDEPKKHDKAFCRAYNTLDEEGHHAAQILGLLNDAGLKIVEK